MKVSEDSAESPGDGTSWASLKQELLNSISSQQTDHQQRIERTFAAQYQRIVDLLEVRLAPAQHWPVNLGQFVSDSNATVFKESAQTNKDCHDIAQIDKALEDKVVEEAHWDSIFSGNFPDGDADTALYPPHFVEDATGSQPIQTTKCTSEDTKDQARDKKEEGVAKQSSDKKVTLRKDVSVVVGGDEQRTVDVKDHGGQKHEKSARPKGARIMVFEDDEDAGPPQTPSTDSLVIDDDNNRKGNAKSSTSGSENPKSAAEMRKTAYKNRMTTIRQTTVAQAPMNQMASMGSGGSSAKMKKVTTIVKSDNQFASAGPRRALGFTALANAGAQLGIGWHHAKPRRTPEETAEFLDEALGAIEADDIEFLTSLVEEGLEDTGPAIVKAAARMGNMDMLEMLQKHHVWSPLSEEGTKAVIEGAVIGGHLPALLQHYELPLDKFPHIAHDFVLLLSKYRQLRETALAHSCLQFLLASFIVVPGKAAEELLEMITQDILFVKFKDNDSTTDKRDQQNDFEGVVSEVRQLEDSSFNISKSEMVNLKAKNLWAAAKSIISQPTASSKTSEFSVNSAKETMTWVAIMHNFPHTLPPIYIRPEITESAIKECAVYKRAERKVVLLMQSRSCELNTSEEARVQNFLVSDTNIPSNAVRFAYIYGSVDFPIGGFLYVDGCGNLIAINSISFSKRRTAFWFGEFISFSKACADKLHKEKYAHSCTPGTEIYNAGARSYLWVCPGEELVEANGNECKVGPQGGFAYFFDDAARNRFFPIVGSGEVIDRACLASGMNADCFAKDPDGGELLSRIARLERRSLVLPVMMKRLTVPGATHIVVLHSLATTRRLEVFETAAAKAIIKAAWTQIAPEYYVDLTMATLLLVTIVYMSFVVRAYVEPEKSDIKDVGAISPTFQAGVLPLTWDLILSFSFLGLFWVRILIKELRKARAFYNFNWGKKYFDLRSLVEWTDICICGSNLLLLIFSSAPASALFPLLALSGFWRWIKILDLLRGYDGVGSRVLPIFEALKEIAPFGLILSFFVLGFVHAFYMVSHRDLLHVLISTYRLGVLGEVDPGPDILGVDDEGRTAAVHGTLLEHALPWSKWQHVAFVLASFVFTVAMMNIFIGIMSQAYHDNVLMAEKLFLRTRASMAVIYNINKSRMVMAYNFIFSPSLRGLEATEEFVWFCHEDHEDT